MDSAETINIIQWNICGIRAKKHHLQAAAATKGIDIFLLQETKLPDTTFTLPGYQSFLLPQAHGRQGLATLVRNTLPSSIIRSPPDCGDGNEVLGVTITTKNNIIRIYNIYKNPNTDFIARERLSTAQYDTVIIAGDFNAHHPRLNPSLGKTNPTGTHLTDLLDQTPEISLMTEPQATHIKGGTLDLTLVSTDLYPNAHWNIHPTLTSDHFAIEITIKDAAPNHTTPPLPKWSLKRINWECFQNELEEWSRAYNAPDDLN